MARALGPTEVFESERDALFYEDVLSARLFYGGARLRADQKGVGALVQGGRGSKK